MIRQLTYSKGCFYLDWRRIAVVERPKKKTNEHVPDGYITVILDNGAVLNDVDEKHLPDILEFMRENAKQQRKIRVAYEDGYQEGHPRLD